MKGRDIQRHNTPEKWCGSEGDDGCHDQGVENRAQYRNDQDRDGRNTVDLETAKNTRLTHFHQWIGQTQDIARHGDENDHGRDQYLIKTGEDAGHDQSHHGIETQREQVIHQQVIGIAQSGLEFKQEMVDKSAHFRPPLVVISRNRSSSDGRSTRRSIRLSFCFSIYLSSAGTLVPGSRL